jgi:hypothetical protein
MSSVSSPTNGRFHRVRTNDDYSEVMTVFVEERRKWERQVAGLRQMENDDDGTPEWRESVEEAANMWRAQHGIAPLKEWWWEELSTEPWTA